MYGSPNLHSILKQNDTAIQCDAIRWEQLENWHFSWGYNFSNNDLILILKTSTQNLSERVVHKSLAYEKCPFLNCSDLIASHCEVRCYIVLVILYLPEVRSIYQWPVLPLE